MTTTPLASGKNQLRFGSGWLLIGLLQSAVLYWFGFDWETAATDGFLSSGFLAAACWLISGNLEYYRPQQGRYLYIGIWCLLLAGIVLAAQEYLLPTVIDDNPAYHKFLHNSWPVRFFIGLLTIGWMAMVSMLWYNQQEQEAALQRKADAEKLTREAELYKLRLQLQPHFLFNSLNSINALIGSQPKEARKMVLQLSEFLRSTLKKDEYEWVNLTEELQHLRLYLEIEKMRFGHRLATEISHDETAAGMRLPPMLLQPLVENAIKFGLYDTTGEVSISLEATAENNMLFVTVRNPYDPQTSATKRGTGFGLSGVQRRLYLLFGRNDLLQTHAENHLFTSTLKIPQNA